MLSGLRRSLHAHGCAFADCMLLHDNAVGSGAQRSPREDARGPSLRERPGPGRIARGDLSSDAQRSARFARPKRIAVHHRDVGRGLVAPGADCFSEDAAVRLGERDLFGRKRPRAVPDRSERLFQGSHHPLGTRKKQKSPGRWAEAPLSSSGRRPLRSGVRRRGVGGAEERTRTSTGVPPPEPESGVSCNSTTSARRQIEGRDLAKPPTQVKKAGYGTWGMDTSASLMVRYGTTSGPEGETR